MQFVFTKIKRYVFSTLKMTNFVFQRNANVFYTWEVCLFFLFLEEICIQSKLLFYGLSILLLVTFVLCHCRKKRETIFIIVRVWVLWYCRKTTSSSNLFFSSVVFLIVMYPIQFYNFLYSCTNRLIVGSGWFDLFQKNTKQGHSIRYKFNQHPDLVDALNQSIIINEIA